MFNLPLITVLTAAILLLDVTTEAHSTETCTVTHQLNVEDSHNPATSRRALYQHTADTPLFSFTALNESHIFRTDGTALSEMLRFHPSMVSFPFTLSGSLNRALPYGNVIDLNTTSGLSLTPGQFSGSDYTFSTQMDAITIGPGPKLSATHFPKQLTTPEVVAFWENGVFDENILTFRFARPLSRNLMFNFFSNYRHFEGKRFSHERNNVIDFYENFTDSSLLMNRGYNPLTNEHITGAQIKYIDSADQYFYGSLSYGDLSNDFALDVPTQSPTALKWADLDRYIYRFEIGAKQNISEPLFYDFSAKLIDERYRFVFPADSQSTGKKRADIDEIEYSLNLGYALTPNDTAGLHYQGKRRKLELFNDEEQKTFENIPRVFYRRSLYENSTGSGFFKVSAGYSILNRELNTQFSPLFSTSLDLTFGDNHLNLFARRDAHTIYPGFDTLSFVPDADPYYHFGAELLLRHGDAGLLLGYQNIYGLSDLASRSVWPQNTPPYAQPAHVFLIAPGIRFNNGLTLTTRALISDTKPHLKASGIASLTLDPSGTSAVYEGKIAFDYWSERDPVLFAGHTSWNNPIYDLNLTLSAHISSFRLFYKVNNLLNRRHAWVPGYFSPGVTFRWGVNWYIQR
ncbi:hypothetical protein QA601_16480 [Chitinispirillales bacterium ANBcel5]|uniref:hypothetical protein n=1 Tax=Cellulosispirillum alkaliphilum TaxID=3039283 RepID=UPI002A57AC27|nr:hypothetical protein [Chitinispirillales bacterium ANBcel5]